MKKEEKIIEIDREVEAMGLLDEMIKTEMILRMKASYFTDGRHIEFLKRCKDKLANMQYQIGVLVETIFQTHHIMNLDSNDVEAYRDNATQMGHYHNIPEIDSINIKEELTNE